MASVSFVRSCGLALTLLVAGISTSLASDTERNCDPEPTDMTIVYGELLIGDNCMISGGGEVDLFRFNGSPGDLVVLSVGDGTGDPYGRSYNPCFEVRDPSNQVVVANGCASNGSKRVVEFALPTPGKYLILVRENSADAVAYGLSLDRFAPPTASSDPITCYGCEVSSSISPLGDIDPYLFSGTAGDQILVTLIDRTSNPYGRSYDPCMDIRRPDGTQTPNGARNYAPNGSVTTIEETLPATGVYTILIDENSADAVAFGLDVQCLFGPCAGPQPLVTSAPDVDGNGSIDALTDGLLLIRYFFGFRDDALINSAAADNCQRCTAFEIEAYLAYLESLTVGE